ncbi:helix-turn-helix domain-containing protein [Bradyrhizobium guangdongense]|uniref:helix-turn-helix domain-containing protein n=1 Tax=Bradyrhizobium guangdongense TaxID=1325090 RepID=UPI001FD8A7CE|nr:LysR family transcriptional regulator [Bradyrhizobium guangdongense]
MNLHLLRLFATVVRTGSFSRAADALHISQPAISKGVRDFELQVGCRLRNELPRGGGALHACLSCRAAGAPARLWQRCGANGTRDR